MSVKQHKFKYSVIEWELDGGRKQLEAIQLSAVAVEGDAMIGSKVNMQWPHPESNQPSIWVGHIRYLTGRHYGTLHIVYTQLPTFV